MDEPKHVLTTMKQIEHRGYVGTFEIDPDLGIFTGHVLSIRDEIYFEGRTPEELTASMRRAVDHYLESCERRGKSPDKPFSGKFTLRMPKHTHRRVAEAADVAGESMSEWVNEAIEHRLQGSSN